MKKKLEALKVGLGNGLKLSTSRSENFVNEVNLDNCPVAYNSVTDEWYITSRSWTYNLNQIKPHHFNLEYLTKPIRVEGYNDGEEFVLMEIIGKLFIDSGQIIDEAFCWDLPTGGDDYQDYSMRIIHVDGVLKMETWCGQYYEDSSYLIEVHGLEYTAKNLMDRFHFNTEGLAPSDFIDASESKVYEPKQV